MARAARVNLMLFILSLCSTFLLRVRRSVSLVGCLASSEEVARVLEDQVQCEIERICPVQH